MKKGRRNRRGNAIIEFALSSAILLPCFTGSFQFGYALYSYNRLCSAVGNGARYAAFRTYRSGNANSIEMAKAAARNMVVFGTTTPSQNAQPLVRGLDPSKVLVQYTLDARGVPVTVRVSVTTLRLNAVVGTFTFNGKPASSYPFMGRYAPEESES